MTNPLLDGLRVIDLSRLLPGPFCTLYLAQLGADVIKIEEPNGGDYTRSLLPELFELVNRGKKSVTLDLRQADAVEALKQLIVDADVLVESFRPGVMDKLGLGYDALKAINPRLVYASLTGYGHSGPYRDRAGHDMNYCAYAGALDQIGEAGGPPALSNVQIADLAGGALTCATGLLAAVIGARSSGKGCFVDVAMLDGTLALQTVAMATLRTHGQTQPRGGDMLTGALPNYGLYRCRDGGYIAVGALEPKFFTQLLRELWTLTPPSLRKTLEKLGGTRGGGQENPPPAKNGVRKKAQASSRLARMTDAAASPAKARRMLAPARWALAAVFRLKSRDEWDRLLSDKDACISPVLTLEEALRNEQVQSRELVEYLHGKPALRSPIRFIDADTRSGVAPKLGEHTQEVLGALRPHA